MPKNLRGGNKHKKSKNYQEPLNKPKTVQYPDKTNNETIAIIRKRLGASRVLVDCDDGRSRQAIISGKFKKKVWMVIDDIVLCEIGTTGNESVCTIIHKYSDHEINLLKNDGMDWLDFTRDENEDILEDVIEMAPSYTLDDI